MTHCIIDAAGRIVRRVGELVAVAEHKGFRILPETKPAYDPQTQELVAPAEPIPENATAVVWTVRATTAPRRAAILRRLAELDLKVTRGLEDTWEALGLDLSTLPQPVQDAKTEKDTLRAELAGL